LLPGGLDDDLDTRLAALLARHELEPGDAAREDLREHLRELHVRRGERLVEPLARRPRELRDRLAEVLERSLEIRALLAQELVALTHLLVLRHRAGIDVAQTGDPASDLLRPRRLLVTCGASVLGDLGQRLDTDPVALEQPIDDPLHGEPTFRRL